mgnify:CR=1 FL=1|jgi:hypothetical protein|tara:strand:+ start:2152 stop:2370 length:219 start_codon:yes stop_codon:yes gene_type:complete
MSAHDLILEFIWDEVDTLEEKGLLEDEINEVAHDTGKHPDDDREEILGIIVNNRLNQLGDKNAKEKRTNENN